MPGKYAVAFLRRFICISCLDSCGCVQLTVRSSFRVESQQICDACHLTLKGTTVLDQVLCHRRYRIHHVLSIYNSCDQCELPVVCSFSVVHPSCSASAMLYHSKSYTPTSNHSSYKEKQSYPFGQIWQMLADHKTCAKPAVIFPSVCIQSAGTALLTRTDLCSHYA